MVSTLFLVVVTKCTHCISTCHRCVYILTTCYLGHWSNAKCSRSINKWTDGISAFYGSYKKIPVQLVWNCASWVHLVLHVTRNLSKYINIKNPPLTSSFSSAPFVIVKIAVRLHWGKWREAGNAGKDGTPMPTAGRVLYNMVITWNSPTTTQVTTPNLTVKVSKSPLSIKSFITLLARDVVFYTSIQYN